MLAWTREGRIFAVNVKYATDGSTFDGTVIGGADLLLYIKEHFLVLIVFKLVHGQCFIGPAGSHHVTN